jgi:uncharacterized RDD family membrane protein YckC
VNPPAGPAGVVTRVIAAVVDTIVVAVASGLLYVGVVAARFAWSAVDFTWPRPSSSVALTVSGVLAIAYLTIAWATTGRTYGAGLLGVRVLSARHGVLGWFRAGVRAAACVLFPLGLLWCAVSRSRRSLHDILVRSVVVYDWHRDRGVRATAE